MDNEHKKSPLRREPAGLPGAKAGLRTRQQRIDSAIDEAVGSSPEQPTQPAKKPKKNMTLREFYGMADGGLKPPRADLTDGGYVRGAGGPTDDKVGPVAMSDSEYLLPADTVEAVGVENLDALRLATHKFVDKKNREGIATMANGGRGPMATRTSRLRDHTPKKNNSSNLSRLGKAGGVVGGALAAKDIAENGASPTSIGDAAASGLMFAGPVGRAAGTGWAVGRAVGGAMEPETRDAIGRAVNTGVRWAGDKLGRDWGVDDTALRELDAAKPATAPVTGNTASPVSRPVSNPVSNRLASMGVPLDQQAAPPVSADARRSLLRQGGGTPGTYTSLGNNIYGTTDTPNGRLNRFVGAGAEARPQPTQSFAPPRAAPGSRNEVRGPTSAASEINRRYDALAERLRGMYGPRSQGNLARRLMELERDRAGALQGDASNLTQARGQDISSRNANAVLAQNANSALRDFELGRMQMEQGRLKGVEEARSARAKAAKDAEKEGYERYNEIVSNMFINPETNTPDLAKQEQFRTFLQSSDLQLGETDFVALPPQEQAKLIEDFRLLSEMTDVRNDVADTVTRRVDMPVGLRNASLSDISNYNLGVGSYLKGKLPGVDSNIVITESGQAVPLRNYAATDGRRDNDKLDLIYRRLNQSPLRGE